MNRVWHILTAILGLSAIVALPALAAIATTKHNLSVSGPGALKAASESEICIFCHAPHNAAPSGQLWNRNVGTTYTPYTSSTRKSTPGQPTGASLLCLSCHDGTIALGKVLNRATPITMQGGALTGNTLIGTNLADDHPVSFVYDATLRSQRGELADPATLVKPSKVRLDASGQLQCTSCHDPHDNTNTKFLVIANTASALCQTCHLKNYWANSDHKTSTKTWNGIGTNPWPHTTGTTVAANACENCHRPHTAGGPHRLLNYPAEESNCFSCHNGNVAAKNLQSEFSKFSTHAVANYTGTHDPSETDPVATEHVECADCHNPHAVNASGGSFPGSLAGTRGITISGASTNPATLEYEICFRCHADGAANVPSSSTARLIAQNNKRLEFQTTNPSFHPVAGPGRSSTMPSLSGMTLNGVPLTSTSVIKCTDCHNNNSGPGAGGTGPKGPHGSTYKPLLERNYTTTDPTSENASAYALCYKCHNRNSILSQNVTGSFTFHWYHVAASSNVRAPCNTCHDPHGISGTQGTVLNNSRLMNFNSAIVTPSPGNGAARWERVGTIGGKCYLTCHGINHNGWSYSGGPP